MHARVVTTQSNTHNVRCSSDSLDSLATYAYYMYELIELLNDIAPPQTSHCHWSSYSLEISAVLLYGLTLTFCVNILHVKTVLII